MWVTPSKAATAPFNYSTSDTVEATATTSYYWNGETYTQSGDYTYNGLTVHGCDSTIVLHLTINDPIGTPDVPSLDDITLYPNPTSGPLTISADNVIQVQVFDRLGRNVAAYHHTNRLDLTRLPSGTYTLRITFPQGHAVRRVVKR